MAFKSQVVYSFISVFLLGSLSYICEARPVDAEGTYINANLTQLNTSRNGSTQTDSSVITTTTRPTSSTQGSNATKIIIITNMVMQIKHIQSNRELEHYKAATIGLAASCALLFIALVFLTLRCRAKSTSSNMPAKDETPIEFSKEPVDSEYQSIRGLPRRGTGNSYGYETVKPKLPPARSPLAYLLQSNDGDYENLKSHVRESNPYVPMNEALAGSVLNGNALTGSVMTGSAIVLSGGGGDEDIYLTMKKLIKTPTDADKSVEQTNYDLGNI